MREIAERLNTTVNAVRFMELGQSETLLRRAIEVFGPEWKLPESWFYEADSPAIGPVAKEGRVPYNFGEMIDLPIYVGALYGEEKQCQWIMSTPPSTRPIRSGFLSADPSEYFQLVVAGDQYSPRIKHGAIVLIRKIAIAAAGTLVLAQPKDLGRAIIGVFDPTGWEYTDTFPAIKMHDQVIGQLELIHHPTIAGPNLEFDGGTPLMETKGAVFYQKRADAD